MNLDPDIKADVEPACEALTDVVEFLRNATTVADLADVERVLTIHASTLNSIRWRQTNRVMPH